MKKWPQKEVGESPSPAKKLIENQNGSQSENEVAGAWDTDGRTQLIHTDLLPPLSQRELPASM